MSVEVITFQDWRKNDFPKDQVVVTVSKSKNWSKGLSPFIVGPCKLYDNYEAKNMENAWQYSKVYPQHVDNNKVKDEYFEWAEKGWNKSYGDRYPMGKGAIPLFSLWKVDGKLKRLNYIEARKQIYIPLYYKAVKDTDAFRRLKETYENMDGKTLYLVDFDAYRHKSMNKTYKQVINNPDRKMGHAFILAMMLEIPTSLERAIIPNFIP